MFNSYEVISLICCRGGSKGIPGKNIKNFCGKPLIGWIIEAAKEARIFDDIILSTDSEEIAEIAESFGATVPGLRPLHLAQDDSNVFDTHKYIFQKLNIIDKTHRVCILMNNPFINTELIIKGYELACNVDFQKVVLDTVQVSSDYIYFRQCYQRDSFLKFHFPKEMLKSKINRQSDNPTFVTINNMRWGKPSFMDDYGRYKAKIESNGIAPLLLPKTQNFDLDDSDDWEIAEAVWSSNNCKLK